MREGLGGLDHVDALLRLYGVDPAAVPIPLKRPHHVKRSGLGRAIMDALREHGPLTGAALAAKVGRGLSARRDLEAHLQGASRDEGSPGE